MAPNHGILFAWLASGGRGFDPGVPERGQANRCRSEAGPSGNRKTAAAPSSWHRTGDLRAKAPFVPGRTADGPSTSDQDVRKPGCMKSCTIDDPYGIGEGIKGWLSKTERAHRREVEFVAMERLLALQWAILDRHFQYQIRLVGHFREVGPASVLRMWRTQTNKDGKHLSQFERDALKERYCELFGTWPR
jgi:hypothetical protein